MSNDLTVGVEEEFQIVEHATTELAHGYDRMMQHAGEAASTYMKPEFLQCVVECVTEPCRTIAEAARSTMIRRASAIRLAERHHMALVSAGTHPSGRWYHMRRTVDTQRDDRYEKLEVLLQDVARSILIFGLHVHVNVEDRAARIAVFNQARTFIPYILALTANSPFWMGRLTGYMSYRTIVWAPFPMSGIPESFASVEAFDQHVAFFAKMHALEEPRRLWWDIRPHFRLPTVEFRIADMPATYADTVNIAAFCQALVKTILDRTAAGHPLPIVPTAHLNENRWRAARYGLRGTLIDFHSWPEEAEEAPATIVIGRALDLVSDAAKHLGTCMHLDHLRRSLQPGVLMGAEQQIRLFRTNQDIADVTRYLMRQTRAGIDLDYAWPLRS